MVPIFTYRDERKLLALIAALIVAALIALVQSEAQLAGKASPISSTVGSALALVEFAVTGGVNGVRHATSAVTSVPSLWDENHRLHAENRNLRGELAASREALATAGVEARFAALRARIPGAIAASIIGYDPENALRVVTLDRGSRSGVVRDAGVVADGGAVGRVIEVGPFTSQVLLITDYTSSIPAVVQRGRWWGIAKGSGPSRVQLAYVSQDAKLRAGDVVVTGEGRSFHAGVPIGTIVATSRSQGALYETAVLRPSVEFGRLERVLVLPRTAVQRAAPAPKRARGAR